MRKLIALIGILAIFQMSMAGITRVNNNPGVNADFNNLQVALDSANPGDTIYLEASPTSYGTISINKPVNIFGPGGMIVQNPGFTATKFTAKITTLNIFVGGVNSSFTGLEFNGTVNMYSGNFAITRCYFNPPGTTNSIALLGTSSGTNILIAQNYIRNNINHGTGVQSRDFTFQNNYFEGAIYTENTSRFDFTNNVLRINGASQVHNSTFINNIIIPVGASSNLDNSTTYFNNFFNNIVAGSAVYPLDTGTGNQVNIPLSAVFVDASGQTIDSQYQIKENGPADGTGFEIPQGVPTDIGMYGGPSPYQISGVTALPTIFDLVVPASNTTGQLNVNIKARAQE